MSKKCDNRGGVAKVARHNCKCTQLFYALTRFTADLM